MPALQMPTRRACLLRCVCGHEVCGVWRVETGVVALGESDFVTQRACSYERATRQRKGTKSAVAAAGRSGRARWSRHRAGEAGEQRAFRLAPCLTSALRGSRAAGISPCSDDLGRLPRERVPTGAAGISPCSEDIAPSHVDGSHRTEH